VETKTKVKLGIGILAAVLLAVFIIQNRHPVDVILITGQRSLPLALVILLMLAVGLVIGYFYGWATRKPSSK